MKANGNPLGHGSSRIPESSTNLNSRVLFVLSSFLGDSFASFFLPFFISWRLEMMYTVVKWQGFVKLLNSSPNKVEYPVHWHISSQLGTQNQFKRITTIRIIEFWKGKASVHPKKNQKDIFKTHCRGQLCEIHLEMSKEALRFGFLPVSHHYPHLQFYQTSAGDKGDMPERLPPTLTILVMFPHQCWLSTLAIFLSWGG